MDGWPFKFGFIANATLLITITGSRGDSVVKRTSTTIRVFMWNKHWNLPLWFFFICVFFSFTIERIQMQFTDPCHCEWLIEWNTNEWRWRSPRVKHYIEKSINVASSIQLNERIKMKRNVHLNIWVSLRKKRVKSTQNRANKINKRISKEAKANINTNNFRKIECCSFRKFISISLCPFN